MGGRQSGPQKIAAPQHVRGARRKRAYKKKASACRDTCRVTEVENDYEILVERLRELEDPGDKSDPESTELQEIGTDFSRNTAACQTSETFMPVENEGHGSTLRISCDDRTGNLKDFLEKNGCKFGNVEGTDLGHCNEREPHLHGHFNGTPIILKLFETTEEDGSKQDRDVYSSPSLVAEAEFSKSKNSSCGIRRDKYFRSDINRQTSPMRRIQSANTSPCCGSKECLKSANHAFPGSKRSRDDERIEKCAASESTLQFDEKKSSDDRSKLPDETSSRNPESHTLSTDQRKKKRSKGDKKRDGKKIGHKRRAWLKPPIPALKSEPLSDPSTNPNHIWFGENAYALEDEEPKPRGTFNSENTARREKTKARANENRELTIANTTVSPKNSPSRSWKIERNNLTDKVERDPKYITHSVLFSKNSACPFRNYMKNFMYLNSACDVLRNSRICCGSESKYTFLSSRTKELSAKTTPSFRNLCDGIPAPTYLTAPVRVPRKYKIWHKKLTNLRKKSSDVTDIDRDEPTFIIARTPPFRSREGLMMAAKTVITVRENLLTRRYSDNCGVEDNTPARSEGKVTPTFFRNKREKDTSPRGKSAKESENCKWLKEITWPFKKSETPRVPLSIISKESINSKKNRSESSNSYDPGLESSPKTSRDSLQTLCSSDQSIEIIEESNRVNRSTKNFCTASRPTRYCGDKATEKVRRRSRASKSRKERQESNTPYGTVGLFDSMKKSYKNRVRPFFAKKSTHSLRRIGRIFTKVHDCSGKSSAKEVPGRGIGRSSSTDVELPIMESKLTWTSGSNCCPYKIEPENWPDEEGAVSPMNNTDAAVSTEDQSSYHKEEVPVRSDGAKSEEKKSGSVLACCIKPATSPTETQTSQSVEDLPMTKKRRWKFKKVKNRS